MPAASGVSVRVRDPDLQALQDFSPQQHEDGVEEESSSKVQDGPRP